MTHRIKKYAIRVVSLLTLFIFAGTLNFAWAQSPLTAEVDRTTVSMDEDVSLTVTINGDFLSIPQPDLSALTDFSVVSSGTSTQISLVNGEMTSTGIFYFQLRPAKEGTLVIPPISVTIDGLTYQTDPINIEVVAGSGPTLSEPPVDTQAPESLAGQDLFVEAEVDNVAPYVGQQITHIFRFYQAVDAPMRAFGRPGYHPPPFTNFLGQTVLSQPQYSTLVDDRNYLVTEVRTALFPANPGPVTIDPAMLEIPGDFFTAGMVLETEPVSLQVQSLPDDAPSNFSGAVGQFEMRAVLDSTEGTVNEPLTLFVDIEGTGNLDFVTEPELPDLPGWRIFDSQSTGKTEVQDDAVYGRRRFERLLVPGQSGDYEFPPLSFSYYNPNTNQYHTLETDPIPITIAPDESTNVSPLMPTGGNQQLVQLTGVDIRHIKPVPKNLESTIGSLLAQPLYWAFWILPVFIVLGVWVWQSRRQRLLKDTAYARSKRARRVALKILGEADQQGADGYGAVQRALLGYLSDKLNRPTVGLTTDELTDVLQKQKIDPALVERVRLILTEIDAARFAPVEETAVKSLAIETQHLINDLEKALGGKR